MFFAWENLQWGFCDVGCSCSFIFYLHFIFDLHFVVVLHFVVALHLLMFLIHTCFSTSSLTLPWTIAGFLHPFYAFSPARHRVICKSFIFNHSVIFLPRVLRFWVGIFLPTGVFYLALLHRQFTCFYQKLPWKPAVLPWGLQGVVNSIHRPGSSVYLIHKNRQSS